MTDLRALLTKVQQCKAPDKHLDVELAKLFAPDDEALHLWPDAPRYTASLDTTLGVLAEQPQDWWWSIQAMGAPPRSGKCYYLARVINVAGAPRGITSGFGDTPALALVQVIIKALIATAEEEEGMTEL